VTGASSGIGAAIAEALAVKGVNVVLVARRSERLDALAATLRSRYAIEVMSLAADLTNPDAPKAISDVLADRLLEVDILINNAGIAAYGEFQSSQLDQQLAMVRLNCQAVVDLTHRFLPAMVARRRGHILIVATTTLAPAAYMSVYAATKGFDLLFAEGLAEEVDQYGVNVSALCPGPVQTEMLIDTDGSGAHPNLQTAQDVARKAVSGLMRGRRYIRPSFMAKLMANAPRFLPRATISGAIEAVYRPKYL
jgi:short-subunit dehydrogenase